MGDELDQSDEQDQCDDPFDSFDDEEWDDDDDDAEVNFPPIVAYDRDMLKAVIARHEGSHAKVYLDSEGHPTIGIGFNLDREGARATIEALGLDYDKLRAREVSLTDEQIDALFDTDVTTAEDAARNVVQGFDGLDADRKIVLVDMAFNLGAYKFSGPHGFTNMIAAVGAGEYELAADEMTKSLWYGQVKTRALEDIAVMRGQKRFPEDPDQDPPLAPLPRDPDDYEHRVKKLLDGMSLPAPCSDSMGEPSADDPADGDDWDYYDKFGFDNWDEYRDELEEMFGELDIGGTSG